MFNTDHTTEVMLDYLLREFVKRSPHCNKCEMRHEETNVCFFASKCIVNDFQLFKEKTLDNLE